MLYQHSIQTVQGPMVAIVDEAALYLLEFVNRKGIDAEIKRLSARTKQQIVSGRTAVTDSIEAELHDYFAGKLQAFKTVCALVGSPFQKSVWQALQRIPAGQTVSYKALATELGRPNAFRAVARANATNQLALIVPCHRVIATGGGSGGYAAGVERKQWLLQHERSTVADRERA